MVWALSPSPETDDRYLLRGLVWCGLCGVATRAVLVSTSRRFYGCTSPDCPRCLIPADLTETLAWQAFLYLFAECTAEATATEQRQALARALERVTVGVDLGDARYRWRELPAGECRPYARGWRRV